MNAGSFSRIAAGNRAYILTRKQSTPISPAWKRFGRRSRVNVENFAHPRKNPSFASGLVPLAIMTPFFMSLFSKKQKNIKTFAHFADPRGSSGSPRSKYKHRRTLTFEIKKTTTQERGQVTHILCKVSCFLLKSFHFCRLRKR